MMSTLHLIFVDELISHESVLSAVLESAGESDAVACIVTETDKPDPVLWRELNDRTSASIYWVVPAASESLLLDTDTPAKQINTGQLTDLIFDHSHIITWP